MTDLYQPRGRFARKALAPAPIYESSQVGMVATITLPYPPSVNRWWRIFRNRIIVSKEGRAYKAKAAMICAASGIKPFSGVVKVQVDIYRPAKRGDIDNTQKVLLDSLSGVAYGDDSQIIELHARRFDDKHNPRAEVTITKLEASHG